MLPDKNHTVVRQERELTSVIGDTITHPQNQGLETLVFTTS